MNRGNWLPWPYNSQEKLTCASTHPRRRAVLLATLSQHCNICGPFLNGKKSTPLSSKQSPLSQQHQLPPQHLPPLQIHEQQNLFQHHNLPRCASPHALRPNPPPHGQTPSHGWTIFPRTRLDGCRRQSADIPRGWSFGTSLNTNGTRRNQH